MKNLTETPPRAYTPTLTHTLELYLLYFGENTPHSGPGTPQEREYKAHGDMSFPRCA